MRRFLVCTLPLLFALGGCSTKDSTPEGQGNLRDMLTLAVVSDGQAAQSGAREAVVIGEARIEEPGSGVWDEPEGLTVGWVQPGSYAVYATRDSWLQVQVVEGGDFDYPWVWVPNSAASFIPAE